MYLHATIEQQEKYSKLSTPSSSRVSGLERQVTSLSNQLSKQSDANRKTLQELKSVQLQLSRIDKAVNMNGKLQSTVKGLQSQINGI